MELTRMPSFLNRERRMIPTEENDFVEMSSMQTRENITSEFDLKPLIDRDEDDEIIPDGMGPIEASPGEIRC